jgi:hypothetical protein
MFSNADQEATLRFIFSSEENVNRALGVLAVRQSIQERIIKDFSASLEAELALKARQLDGTWTVVNEFKTTPSKEYTQIYLTKTNWNNLYCIALQAEKPGARDVILGVQNDWNTLGGQRLDGGAISKALRGHVRSGRTTEWWPFCMWADPYRHWDNARTLACFRGAKSVQAISELAGAMFTMAQVTEQTIDTVVQKWFG